MIIKISLFYKEVPDHEQDECTFLASSLDTAVLICILLFTGVQEEKYWIPETQIMTDSVWLPEVKKYCQHTTGKLSS